jgi:hypothetical protein
VPILSKRYPELLNEWHPYMNLPLATNGNFHSKKQKIWWVCKKTPRMFFGQRSAQKSLQKKEVVDTVRAKRFSERILCQKTIRTLPLNGT